MLGILIGITAVVLTVGLGQGAKAKVQDQINELGTNLLVISPGSTTDSTGVRGGFGSASTLTQADADAGVTRPLPTSGRRPGRRRRPAALGQRLDQLDHDAHRHHAELADRPLRRAPPRDASSPMPTSRTRQPVVVLGPDTATQLFGAATQSADRSPTTASSSRSSACWRA